MSQPLLIGLAGSPRAGGNSDRLLQAFLQGARSAGVAVDTVAARGLAMTACDGCGACARTGACIHDDEMTAFLQRLETAQGLVIASPVYFAGVPAVLKAVIDRMQPCWVRVYRLDQPRRPKRPGAMLVVGAGGDPFGTAGAEATLTSAMQVCGFSVDVCKRFIGLDAVGDVEGRPQMLQEARREGAALAARILEHADSTA